MSVSKLEGKNQAFPKLWIVDSTERSDFSNNFINEINTQEGHTHLNIVGDQHWLQGNSGSTLSKQMFSVF